MCDPQIREGGPAPRQTGASSSAAPTPLRLCGAWLGGYAMKIRLGLCRIKPKTALNSYKSSIRICCTSFLERLRIVDLGFRVLELVVDLGFRGLRV